MTFARRPAPITPFVDVLPFTADTAGAPPMRLGQRYDRHGFLPEPGNTVVCHLDRDAPASQAVLAARRQLQALPGAEKLLFTPPESLHMTLFEGVLDTRRSPDAWPAGVPPQAQISETTAYLVPRLQRLARGPAFHVQVVGLRPVGLSLAGASEEDEIIMRTWRDALTVPFGYRHGQHDRYRFHMTFAYPLAWLSAQEAVEWRRAGTAILSELIDAAPVLPLRPPAFCRFSDMTHFEELLVLGEGGAPRPRR